MACRDSMTHDSRWSRRREAHFRGIKGSTVSLQVDHAFIHLPDPSSCQIPQRFVIGEPKSYHRACHCRTLRYGICCVELIHHCQPYRDGRRRIWPSMEPSSRSFTSRSLLHVKPSGFYQVSISPESSNTGFLMEGAPPVSMSSWTCVCQWPSQNRTKVSSPCTLIIKEPALNTSHRYGESPAIPARLHRHSNSMPKKEFGPQAILHVLLYLHDASSIPPLGAACTYRVAASFSGLGGRR